MIFPWALILKMCRKVQRSTVCETPHILYIDCSISHRLLLLFHFCAETFLSALLYASACMQKNKGISWQPPACTRVWQCHHRCCYVNSTNIEQKAFHMLFPPHFSHHFIISSMIFFFPVRGCFILDFFGFCRCELACYF